MLNVSSLFRQALANDKRSYLEKFNITLKDGTVLNLTNEHVWSGSLSFEDAVSSDSDLQVGTAIINKETLTLNNIYDDYSAYDFTDAVVVTQIGIVINDEGTVEYIKKGTFTVDTANYDNSLVSLSMLDFMARFEKPFSGVSVTFPATADTLVRALCSHCNVTLGTLDFPHKSFVFQTGPQKESCSCREVLSWVAQAVGCFARCDVNGKLELKWFDRAALEQDLSGLDGGVFDHESASIYTTGDTANGGTFRPWNTGTAYDGGTFQAMRNNVHYISSTFNHTISVDEVIVTGVRILVKTDGSSSAIATHFTGSEGYVIEISNNELITETNADTILAWLGTQLIGLTYRKANISAPSDPSIEAGDVAVVFDRKGNRFPILVSKVTFSPGSQQTIVSAAQNPVRNSASRYSVETKNYVAMHKAINQEKTSRELVEENLRRAIANANGLYETLEVDPQTGATTTYLHNKVTLTDSDIRIMISDVGVLVTANGTEQTPTWYGLTVDGNLIANILNAIGVNADWINTGKLVVKKNGTEMLYVDCDTGTVRISGSTVSLSSGDSISTAIGNAVSSYDNGLTQQAVFNKLTNSGQAQGIYLKNGKLYLNFAYAQGQTLKLGGANNTNGVLEVYNASGTKIGVWDRNGIDIDNGSISIGNTTIDSNGFVATKGTIGGNTISSTGLKITQGSVEVGNNKMDSNGLTVSNGSFGGNTVNSNGIAITKGSVDIGDNVFNSSGASIRKGDIVFTTSDNGTARKTKLNYLGLQFQWQNEYTKDGDSRIYQRAYTSSAGTHSDEMVIHNYDGPISLLFANNANASGMQLIPYGLTDIFGRDYRFILGGETYISGGLTVSNGQKSRLVDTEDYGDRLLYAYETPTPIFGDIGEGVIGEDGKCYIQIDPTFAETISNTQYQVFLQKYGTGECYVSERKSSYFIVEGTPDLAFGWEIKAKQKDYEQRRLDTPKNFSSSGIREDIGNKGISYVTESTVDYGNEAINHIEEINKERMDVA